LMACPVFFVFSTGVVQPRATIAPPVTTRSITDTGNARTAVDSSSPTHAFASLGGGPCAESAGSTDAQVSNRWPCAKDAGATGVVAPTEVSDQARLGSPTTRIALDSFASGTNDMVGGKAYTGARGTPQTRRAKTVPPAKLATTANGNALTAVDGTSSMYAFIGSDVSSDVLVKEKWPTYNEVAATATKEGLGATTTPAAAVAPPATLTTLPATAAATAVNARADVAASPTAAFAEEPRMPPAAAPPSSTMERLAALERALLGDGSPQGQAPILQRLAWLDTQLGSTSGTVLRRLDALEGAAEAQGLYH